MSLPFVIQDAAGHAFPVDGPLSIGRSSSNSIPIQEPLASRTHLRVYPHQDTLYIQDENSTNGTFVNNARISGPTPLKAGDQIRIGSTVFLVALADNRLNQYQVQPADPYLTSTNGQNACPNCHQTTYVKSAANAQLAVPQKPKDTLVKIMTIFVGLMAVFVGLTFLGILGSTLFGAVLSGGLLGDSGFGALSLLSLLPLLLLLPPMVLFVVVPWMVRNHFKQLYHQQLNEWERAQRGWDELLHCAQCAGVFMPGQKRLVPLEHMQAFLYQIFRERVIGGISF